MPGRHARAEVRLRIGSAEVTVVPSGPGCTEACVGNEIGGVAERLRRHRQCICHAANSVRVHPNSVAHTFPFPPRSAPISL